jgi:putative Mg2+ transporter-C (MgtC) family protein
VPEIINALGFSLRLGIALLLGFAIGFERQWTRHTAGILTNVIVCMGSFMFCSFSMIVGGTTDVTRIAAQVVSGIGFLGAGVILRDGLNIRGLNTAATVWATSAVGVLCCLESPIYAVASATAIVLVHILFHPLASYITEKRFNVEDSDSEKMYSISVVCKDDAAPLIREKLMTIINSEKKVLLRNMETHDVADDAVKIKAIMSSAKQQEAVIEKIITLIGVCDSVISTGWKKVD